MPINDKHFINIIPIDHIVQTER